MCVFFQMADPSEKFLQHENQRTRELEDMIDNHIESLKSTSNFAITKHKR